MEKVFNVFEEDGKFVVEVLENSTGIYELDDFLEFDTKEELLSFARRLFIAAEATFGEGDIAEMFNATTFD